MNSRRSWFRAASHTARCNSRFAAAIHRGSGALFVASSASFSCSASIWARCTGLMFAGQARGGRLERDADLVQPPAARGLAASQRPPQPVGHVVGRTGPGFTDRSGEVRIGPRT
jgi:hypothetical protein